MQFQFIEKVNTKHAFILLIFFSRSLNNWQNLYSLNKGDVPFASESPEQRNAREADMFRQNISNTLISDHEILQDANQLKSLGLLLVGRLSFWPIFH